MNNFESRFRNMYRIVRIAGLSGNAQGMINGLQGLCNLLDEQAAKDNGDGILIKAKVGYMRDVFASYLNVIKTCGINDKRVQDFFKLSDAEDIPPVDEVIGGRAEPSATENAEPELMNEKDSAGETSFGESPINIDGLGLDIEEPTLSTPAITPECVSEVKMPSKGLRGFIGQKHIVGALLKEIAIAKANGARSLDNILLFGNPGLGKSTLMRCIANDLGVEYIGVDCTNTTALGLQNVLNKDAVRLAGEGKAFVLALDEIHCLSKDGQSKLLNLLNSRVYDTPPDKNGRIFHVPMDFTFIAATTNDEEVISTIKDRCLRLKFQLTEYSHDELMDIYRQCAAELGLTITDEAIETCIPRSRGSVRYVRTFINGMNTELYDDNGIRLSTHIDAATAKRFFTARRIDEIGLEDKDLEILSALANAKDGFLSGESLATCVNLDFKKYKSEYEPYLIRIGFIVKLSGKGRSLTDKARAYIESKQIKD